MNRPAPLKCEEPYNPAAAPRSKWRLVPHLHDTAVAVDPGGPLMLEVWGAVEEGNVP